MDTLQNNSPEEWRAVVGAEGFYSASTMGRVRSEPTAAKTAGRQRGRVLCPSEDTKGYLIFRVCLPSGVQWTAKVHRVVAEAFLGSCPAGMQVNHKDGNKKNNHPENLEYVSCRENVRHGWANGLYAARAGESHNMARLTEDDVRAIRAIYPARSLTDLAREFGVTVQNVSMIVRRKTWKHVL